MRIDSTQLDAIRSQQELFMDSSATIKRRTFDGDSFGDGDIIAADRPCRVASGFGAFRVVADRYQGISAHVLTFHYNEDIQAGDVVLVGSEVYNIKDIHAPNSTTYLTARQVLADLIS